MNPLVSSHASQRMNQRGVPHADLDLLLRFADIATCHRGRVLVSLGPAGTRELVGEGVDRQRLERLQRTAAVLASDGTVITVLKMHGQHQRRYRGRH